MFILDRSSVSMQVYFEVNNIDADHANAWGVFIESVVKWFHVEQIVEWNRDRKCLFACL